MSEKQARFFSDQLNIIFESTQRQQDREIETDMEFTARFLKQEKRLNYYLSYIQILEGICLLHGIEDLRILVNRPPAMIFQQVHEAINYGCFQLPYAFYTYLKKYGLEFPTKPGYNYSEEFDNAVKEYAQTPGI
jgi:hypothetical protein